jgi:hypothetical protein
MQTPPPDAPRPANTDEPGERERLMSDFGITYNGRHYGYGRYRYGSLADAVNYAKLRRADPCADEETGAMPPLEQVESPNEQQRGLMAELNISFRDGIYRFEDFRYDLLADAVDYARRQRRVSR